MKRFTKKSRVQLSPNQIRELSQGDPKAWDLLVIQNQPFFKRLANKYTSNYENAVQNALIRMFEHRDIIPDLRNVHSWIVCVIIQEAMTVWKRENKHAKRSVQFLGKLESFEVVDNSAISEIRMCLKSRIFTDEERIVITQFLEGYTMREIGKNTKRHHSCAFYTYQNAVDKLRKEFKCLKSLKTSKQNVSP